MDFEEGELCSVRSSAQMIPGPGIFGPFAVAAIATIIELICFLTFKIPLFF